MLALNAIYKPRRQGNVIFCLEESSSFQQNLIPTLINKKRNCKYVCFKRKSLYREF